VHNRIEQTAPSASVCVEEQAAENICVGGWARISTAVNAARKRAADQKAGFLFLVSNSFILPGLAWLGFLCWNPVLL